MDELNEFVVSSVEECVNVWNSSDSVPTHQCGQCAAKLNVSDFASQYNVTCCDEAPSFTYVSMVKVVVLSVMAFGSYVGNVATIINIQRTQKRCRSTVYSLIFHLSIADLFVTVFCMTGEAAWYFTVAWLAGDVMCRLFKFFQMFSLYLSTYVLVLIGVDRFVAVRYPMRSVNAKRCDRLIFAAWAFSALLSLPQIYIFGVKRGPDFCEEFHQCVTYGAYRQGSWQEQLYTSTSILSIFVIPFVVLVSTYFCTFWTIAKSEEIFKTDVRNGNQTIPADYNRRRLMRRAKIKCRRISVAIVSAFIVCWTPYYFMMILSIYIRKAEHDNEDLKQVIFFFGMSNCLINPFIYAAYHLGLPGWKRDSCMSRKARDSSTRRTLFTSFSSRRGLTFTGKRRGSPTKVDDTSFIVLEDADAGRPGSVRTAGAGRNRTLSGDLIHNGNNISHQQSNNNSHNNNGHHNYRRGSSRPYVLHSQRSTCDEQQVGNDIDQNKEIKLGVASLKSQNP